MNGSAATVTYTAECYDKITGSNILSGAASVTLAPKASIDYTGGGECASGTPTYRSLENVVACAGSVLYSNAAALCGASAPLCTHTNLVTRGITSLANFPYRYWFSAVSDPWYSTWDNWSKSSSYATSGGGKKYHPTTNNKGKGGNPNARCHPLNALGSPGTGISDCAPTELNGTANGALCCSTNNGFKSCKVTILPATPTSGSLQSPQFKGGASF